MNYLKANTENLWTGDLYFGGIEQFKDIIETSQEDLEFDKLIYSPEVRVNDKGTLFILFEFLNNKERVGELFINMGPSVSVGTPTTALKFKEVTSKDGESFAKGYLTKS